MPKNRDNRRTSTTDNFLKTIAKQQSKSESKKTEREEYYGYATITNKLKNFGVMVINSLNSFFDRTLSSRGAVSVLSFVFTMLLAFYVNGGDFSSILRTPTSGEFLNEVPVSIRGLDNDLVCLGAPESVTLGLIGPSLDIYSTKLSSDYSIYMDLSDATVGQMTVDLNATGFPRDLQVLIVPQNTTVTIAQKITQTFPLDYEFINRNELGNDLSVSVESLEHQEVEVSGAQSQIDLINSVKAQVDVADQTGSFVQDCPIVAYDRSGNALDVTITPGTVEATCSVSDYSKEVNIVPEYVGQLSSGYAITDITLSDTVVKIYGKEEDLNSISSVSCNIDISDLKNDVSFEDLSLNIPSEVYKASLSSVDVDLKIDENSSTRIIQNIPITLTNNANNYNVTFATNESAASLRITGPAYEIARLTASDIVAAIDMTNVKIGTSTVPVKITIDDIFTYVFVSLDEVEITVSQ